MLKVYFRDLRHDVVEAVRKAFPEWDAARDHIFSVPEADIVISPANCIGRMDGGIDLVYTNRFGWQLQNRLMREIQTEYGGKLPIGQAHLIYTNDTHPEPIRWMISAPTMDWPPGDVSDTDNAYLAFSGALRCALFDGVQVLGREPVLLMPGLATTTGLMTGEQCAQQLRRAWDEVY